MTARMEQLGISSEDEYYERLRGGQTRPVEQELRNLLNLVTVTETCFFRDAAQFRLLREHILPTLLHLHSGGAARRGLRDADPTIRIWSAGCSSGEEAYSIALTLADMGMYRARPEWRVEIVGTDLNTVALDRARQANYSARAVRNVQGRLLERYFERRGEFFQLRHEIARLVTFEFGNLTQTPMPSTGPQDVVFCKNVAIYFRAGVTRKLVRGLHSTIKPGGYLVLGHAESLWQMSDGFTLVEHHGAFCYRKMPRDREHTPAPSNRSGTIKSTRSSRPRRDALPASTEYDACLAAFRNGEWHDAEARLLRLIVACPTYVPGYLLLGGVYVHRARYDEAIVQAKAVLNLSDLDPRAHLLIGMIAARQQRNEDAVQSLRRALYLNDSLALAHFWLGNLYRERGDLARACQEYSNVVRDWERHTLELTEEFAADLTAEQIVRFCSDTLELLKSSNRR